MIKKITNVKTHVKIGDEVKILAGKEKGLVGKILFLNHTKMLAQIDSVPNRERYMNLREKQKQLEASLPGELKTIPKFVHLSNLMLWDNENQKASRIGYKVIEKRKVRYFKKSGKVVA